MVDSPYHAKTRNGLAVVAGFTSNASVAVGGMSAAAGDSLISVNLIGSTDASLGRLLTLASCSISVDRIVVTNTVTTNGKLIVFWYKGDTNL